VVAAVIHEVLHGLPEGLLYTPEFQRFVFHDAIEIALREGTNESEQARLKFRPALAEGRDVGILRGVRKRRRRAALEAFEPNPFAPKMWASVCVRKKKLEPMGL